MRYLALYLLSLLMGCQSPAVPVPISSPSKPQVIDEGQLPTREQRLAACYKKILNSDDPAIQLSPYCQGVAIVLAEEELESRGMKEKE